MFVLMCKAFSMVGIVVTVFETENIILAATHTPGIQ